MIQCQRKGQKNMIKVFKVTSKILNQKRNISVYIPDKGKGPFKVLCTHDGQNLFFKEASSYGEIWDAHTQYERFSKAGIIEPHIIVGIDNTKYRMDEYCPFDNSNIYKYYPSDNRLPHYGDKYAKFIVEELKPWIDKKFKTKKDKTDTLIMGASLGGLISLYIGLKYPHIFGGVGCLSTSASWNLAGLDALLDVYKAKPDQKYFVTCGTNESGKNDAKLNRNYTRVSKKLHKQLKPNAGKYSINFMMAVCTMKLYGHFN
jgi:predicted alpha/beta superfamily hydrolase